MHHEQIASILRQELGDELQEQVTLRNHTTMRVGGVADFFWQAREVADLIRIAGTCYVHHIPFLVIGSGSNVIFSDAGFPGLVIHNVTSRIAVVAEKSQIIVDAGCIYARLITEAAAHGLGGLEWWFGLPGTIGGAVHNNAETWGHDMSEVVKQVTLLMPSTEPGGKPKLESVPVEWMQYEYRTSRLKKMKSEEKPVILTVTLQLQQQKKEEIMRRMKEYKQGRFELNQPKGVASSGSFFVNPGGKPTHGEGPRKPEDSAGWLIEQVAGKKMTVGQAGISSEHANFLINKGDASAADIHQLATEIKAKVQEQFSIPLEEEVQYLGVWSK